MPSKKVLFLVLAIYIFLIFIPLNVIIYFPSILPFEIPFLSTRNKTPTEVIVEIKESTESTKELSSAFGKFVTNSGNLTLNDVQALSGSTTPSDLVLSFLKYVNKEDTENEWIPLKVSEYDIRNKKGTFLNTLTNKTNELSLWCNTKDTALVHGTNYSFIKSSLDLSNLIQEGDTLYTTCDDKLCDSYSTVCVLYKSYQLFPE